MERLTKMAKNGQKYVSAIGTGYGCWGRILAKLARYENAEEAGRLAELPCKVGDDIWWIDDEAPFVKCEKGDIKGIVVTADGFMIVDTHGELNRIGTRYCYLTKEDAEKALEEGTYNG